MEKIIDIDIKISSPLLKEYIIRRRVNKAIDYWISNSGLIKEDVDKSEDKEMEFFKWDQLVWQEIAMFCRIGKKKDLMQEIDLLANLRGFNQVQKDFIVNAMRRVYGKRFVG